MILTANDLKKALLNIAQRIETEKDYLSELDRAVGGGDHGVTCRSAGRRFARSYSKWTKPLLVRKCARLRV